MLNLGDVAETVVYRHSLGQEVVNYLGKEFHRYYYDDQGHIKGMCSMFVRLCFEAAAGVPDHAYSVGNGMGNPVYFGGTAKATEAFLKAAGKEVQQGPYRGQIICFNYNSGVNGHIGIAIGDGKFVENTSSTSRGPGTVVSKLSEIGLNRISGLYHVGGVELSELKIIRRETGDVIECNARLEGGVARVDLRPLAEKLGYRVHGQHVQTLGKVFLEKLL